MGMNLNVDYSIIGLVQCNRKIVIYLKKRYYEL